MKKLYTLFVAVWLLLVVRLFAGTPAITVSASPSVAQSPANIVITVHIERSDANRQLSVVCDSGEHYLSEDVTLDGANSKAQWILDKFARHVPPGRYECIAGLFRTTGPHTATTRFEVN